MVCERLPFLGQAQTNVFDYHYNPQLALDFYSYFSGFWLGVLISCIVTFLNYLMGFNSNLWLIPLSIFVTCFVVRITAAHFMADIICRRCKTDTCISIRMCNNLFWFDPALLFKKKEL